MNRRGFLGAAAGGLWSTVSRAQSRPPNIVLIIADDLGYGDLGCYGGKLNTPNIDQLASEGVRFRDFYSASAICSPSRAAMMTGRYPVRTGITGVIQANDTTGLPASEITIAHTMKAAGYRTMCVGKWHLGSVPEYLPTNRGFDEYYGLPYSNDMWPLTVYRNSGVIESSARLEMLTQRYGEQAVSFIDRAKDSPFFLMLSYNAPHIPLTASERFRNRSPLGPYGDVVEELDWSVGEVLKSVDDSGLREKTLVMFASDNGPWYQGSRGTFRGRKGESWEGGMRVPFLARLPDTIPAGSVTSGVASSMDLHSTLAKLAGAPPPANSLDGVDIAPLLTGETDQVGRDPLLYFDGVHLQCARIGKWKLHLARFSRSAWNPDPGGGRVNLPLPAPELYNLEADPEESYDCARRYPQTVAEIRARVDLMLPTFPDQVTGAWSETMNRRVESTPAGALPVESRP